MHVSHIQFSYFFIIDVGLNALSHASCSTIGKGKAQHLVKGNALLVRPPNTLGEDLCLTTARCSQH